MNYAHRIATVLLLPPFSLSPPIPFYGWPGLQCESVLDDIGQPRIFFDSALAVYADRMVQRELRTVLGRNFPGLKFRLCGESNSLGSISILSLHTSGTLACML